ncbi:MAG: hypothetical protein ACLFR0_04035 [Alphaproteobacteria bacterium]
MLSPQVIVEKVLPACPKASDVIAEAMASPSSEVDNFDPNHCKPYEPIAPQALQAGVHTPDIANTPNPMA